MKVFLDTNILVDLLADRKPFSTHAIILFEYAETGKLQLFTSSHSIATTHYLLKKYLEEKQLRTVLSELLEFMVVIPVDETVLKKGLRSNHKDFEDALQIICADSVPGMDFIVTRNPKDFKKSGIAVLPPDEMCLLLPKTNK